jgi:DNA polymerase (family 10)/putative hydrolase
MLSGRVKRNMKRTIKYEDTQCGDFHVHTNYTDGKNTIMEYCQKAWQNNLKVIAFTEHVRKNLNYDFNNFVSDIEKVREDFPELKILSGCEAKVLNINGELDAPEEVLDQCDVVMGVFHSFKWKDKKKYLVGLKAMLRDPAVDIWGHPTLFAKEHNIKLEEEELIEIIDICIEQGILIERNFKYNLPDINFIKLAINKGAKFVMGSDAHRISELLTMHKLKEEWGWINKMC